MRLPMASLFQNDRSQSRVPKICISIVLNSLAVGLTFMRVMKKYLIKNLERKNK